MMKYFIDQTSWNYKHAYKVWQTKPKLDQHHNYNYLQEKMMKTKVGHWAK